MTTPFSRHPAAAVRAGCPAHGGMRPRHSVHAEIILRAAEQDRAVVTLDADFHALLDLSEACKPSVIRFRIEGLRAGEFCQILQNVIQQCSEDITSGAVLSVTETQIRVRRLPVG